MCQDLVEAGTAILISEEEMSKNSILFIFES
jgi:hypothetical protein